MIDPKPAIKGFEFDVKKIVNDAKTFNRKD